MSIFCYQHHINDWRRDTGTLTLEQKGIYREMLDWFYVTEGRLPGNIDNLSRMLGLQNNKEKVALTEVIRIFWTLNVDGYLIQKRAQEELQRIKGKSLKASNSAKSKYNNNIKNANAEQSHGVCDTIAVPTNNQYPITNNHKSPIPVPVTAQENGDFKDFGGMGIEAIIDDVDLSKIRQRAPGWDKHFLFREFDKHSRTLGKPDDPKAAFYGWLKKYTKGMPPK